MKVCAANSPKDTRAKTKVHCRNRPLLARPLFARPLFARPLLARPLVGGQTMVAGASKATAGLN